MRLKTPRIFLQTMAASQNIYFYIFAIFFIIGLIDCELRPLKEHDRREQDFDVKPGGDVQIVEETWVKTATNWAIIKTYINFARILSIYYEHDYEYIEYYIQYSV